MNAKAQKTATMVDEDSANLLRKIALHQQVMGELISECKLHIAGQRAAGRDDDTGSQTKHLDLAEPERWTALGRTSIQEGFMFLSRAIAQPEQ